MMTLTRDDYQNLLNILDHVEVKGVKNAQYLALLSVKLNAYLAEFDSRQPPAAEVPKTTTP